jgi:hypothetical protein
LPTELADQEPIDPLPKRNNKVPVGQPTGCGKHGIRGIGPVAGERTFDCKYSSSAPRVEEVEENPALLSASDLDRFALKY